MESLGALTGSCSLARGRDGRMEAAAAGEATAGMDLAKRAQGREVGTGGLLVVPARAQLRCRKGGQEELAFPLNDSMTDTGKCECTNEWGSRYKKGVGRGK